MTNLAQNNLTMSKYNQINNGKTRKSKTLKTSKRAEFTMNISAKIIANQRQFKLKTLENEQIQFYKQRKH